MNLFLLCLNPVSNAKYHCDQHVVKMIIETAQMLYTAHHLLPSETSLLSAAPGGGYRKTHSNHPVSVWIRSRLDRYLYAAVTGLCLCREFRLRYGKEHGTESHLWWLLKNVPPGITSRIVETARSAVAQEAFSQPAPDPSVENFSVLRERRSSLRVRHHPEFSDATSLNVSTTAKRFASIQATKRISVSRITSRSLVSISASVMSSSVVSVGSETAGLMVVQQSTAGIEMARHNEELQSTSTSDSTANASASRLPFGASFAVAMPDEIREYSDHPVSNYRNFYRLNKATFARYSKCRSPPGWMQLDTDSFDTLHKSRLLMDDLPLLESLSHRVLSIYSNDLLPCPCPCTDQRPAVMSIRKTFELAFAFEAFKSFICNSRTASEDFLSCKDGDCVTVPTAVSVADAGWESWFGSCS